MYRGLFWRRSMGAGLLRSLMEQIQTLIETSPQLGGSQPDRRPAHYEEIGRQLRVLQELRSRLECRHTHQDHRHHQPHLQQSQDCAKKTVETAESGFLHHPTRDLGGHTKDEHDDKKDDEEAKNLS